MKTKLDESDILEILKNYFEDKNTDYAIMIDGLWGSGKTFFVLNKVKKYVDDYFKNRKVKMIYISTYGVKNFDELNNKIRDNILIEFLPKKIKEKYENVEKSAESAYNIVKELLKLSSIPRDSINTIIDILQRKNEKQYIMVFDDIERCQIPISELLGYINEFVEHKKIKTILISNENEIKKKNLYTNTELKYLVAENEIIDIPKNKDSLTTLFETKYKSDVNEDSKLSIDDINERVRIIFGEDTLYNQIKEKLIGVTIYYEPDFEKVTEAIINDYVNDEKIKEIIQDNKEKIINLMQNKNHSNLRTLKIALNIMEKVLKIVLNLDLSKYEKGVVEGFKKEIIRYTMLACINYKNGEWDNKDSSGVIHLLDENGIYKKYDGFKFIDDFIERGFIDSSKTASIVELYIQAKVENTNEPNDPIDNLKYYWEMDDKDIEKNYNRLKNKLIKNQYKSLSYPQIMYRIIKLITMGFPEKYVSEIKNIMLSNIKDSPKQEEYNDFAELDFAFSNNEEKTKYDEEMKDIKAIMKKNSSKNRVIDINSFINNKVGWGMEFSNYCLKNKNIFQTKNEFFSLLDIDELISVIKNSNTKDISDFRRIVYTIYDFKNIKDYYMNDLSNINRFTCEISLMIESEEFKEYDISKRYNINGVFENCKDVLERLNKTS